jgi:arylsulfatase A-like enzyme
MKKPNILWIFSDQHQAQAMSCAGDVNISTPHLDRLASEGIRFAEAYSNTPLCSPFRASLFTGKYITSHGVVSLHVPPNQGQTMLPEVLKAFGYHTSYMGKWHLSGGAAPNPFTSPYFRPGWDEWLGWENSNRPWATEYTTGNFPQPIRMLDGYQTDALTDLTVQWIHQQSQERPWFHVMSVEPPHSPHEAPEAYMELFSSKELKLRPNVPTDHPNHAKIEQTTRAYYAQIANLDDNVGKLLDALDESGQADNTIVFYFADHGDMMGSHGRSGKSRPEIESSQIPLIIRYPGKAPGGIVTEALISGVDFMPTLLGMVGAPIPEGVEGNDVSSAIFGDASGGASEVLLQFERNFFDEAPEMTFRTIIRDGWHYTCFLTKGPNQLYHVKNDPYQMSNKIHDPAFGQVRESLHQALAAKLDILGDDFMARMQDNS